MAVRQRSDEGGPWLSIGALSKATGIAVETLRTWESRYGFPSPERKPSGHRVYPVSAVSRLRRVAQALALGHRAGQVVSASDDALERLLETSGMMMAPLGAPALALSMTSFDDLPALLRLVRTFDADRLTRVLLTDWARMGPVEFLEARVAPLVRAVGEGWEKGTFEIRHEHFLSERVGDLLASLRLPFEERAAGPLVVCATLPGEAHAIGLRMCALLLAAAGCRVLYLGTEVPVAQTVALARDVGARAVAVSISLSSRGATALAGLRRLRDALPKRVLLIAGGEGAPSGKPGVETVGSLRDLDAWGRKLASGLITPPVGEP